MEGETMMAVRYQRYGGPEVLEYAEAPRPEPGEGEVLLRVKAAGVNPADRQIRAGLRTRLGDPFVTVPGFDVAGIVERTGPGVNTLAAGDAVFGAARTGSYAEYAVAAAEALARKPAGADFAEAAALPVAAVTAWQALFDYGELRAGQRVLIHAAAGGVGHLAVQMARFSGAHVIATASADNADFVRQLGAQQIIDYRTERFEEHARDVDLALDLVPREASAAADRLAAETLERTWGTVRAGGLLVSISTRPAPPAEAAARGVRGRYVPARITSGVLGEIARLVDDGTLHVSVGAALPLSAARRAHELIGSGHTRGKIVLLMS